MLEKSFIEEWIEESENKAFTEGRSEGRAENMNAVVEALASKGMSPDFIAEIREICMKRS